MRKLRESVLLAGNVSMLLFVALILTMQRTLFNMSVLHILVVCLVYGVGSIVIYWAVELSGRLIMKLAHKTQTYKFMGAADFVESMIKDAELCGVVTKARGKYSSLLLTLHDLHWENGMWCMDADNIHIRLLGYDCPVLRKQASYTLTVRCRCCSFTEVDGVYNVDLHQVNKSTVLYCGQ